jgi:hypothetical protein
VLPNMVVPRRATQQLNPRAGGQGTENVLAWWLVVLFKFERKEVDPAHGVTGNDHAVAGEGTTFCGAVAGESGHLRARFQVPHLQRVIIRSGDRTPPILAHRHTQDLARVAGQGGELLGINDSCSNTNGFVLASSNYRRETDACIRTRSFLERFMCWPLRPVTRGSQFPCSTALRQ